jgi:hypothetical protein
VEADLLLSAALGQVTYGFLSTMKTSEEDSFDSQLPVGQKTTTSRTICHYCLITMFHIIYDNIFKSIGFSKTIQINFIHDLIWCPNRDDKHAPTIEFCKQDMVSGFWII